MFWDLQPLWSSSLTKPDLLRFRCFFRACSFRNEVGDPPNFFIFLTSLTHHLSMVKFSETKSTLENFHANILKASERFRENKLGCITANSRGSARKTRIESTKSKNINVLKTKVNYFLYTRRKSQAWKGNVPVNPSLYS